MPAPLAVDKEAVRVLVVAVGPREAARQMGLNENTVLAWDDRGGWSEQARAAKQRANSTLAEKQPEAVQSSAIKPADALANTLAERKKRSQLGLSGWLTESSEHLATLKGEDALAAHQAALSTASVLGKLYPEQAGEDRVPLQFFMIQMERLDQEEQDRGPVVDV